MIDEVLRFNDILRNRFHFATEQWDIPSEEPEDALTSKILGFCKGRSKDSLLILYYAGHGGGGPEKCIWSATRSASTSPWLNWHKIQGHLLEHDPNVLLILDCCFSSLAAGVHSIGDNWFLGSSVKESVALGVHWRSFTSAMVRQLDRAANLYWYEREKYNVLSLAHDITLNEDLLVTPHCLRLNRHHCEPIDLTPLLYPRRRRMPVSARTEPVSREPSQLAGGRVTSRRHRSDHATFLSPSVVLGDTEQSLVPINLAADDYQTLCIKGLPLDAKTEDVVRWLNVTVGSRLSKIKIGPMIQASSGQYTIATFATIADAERALAVQQGRFPNRTGQHKASIEIDHRLQGLTTIYEPLQAPDGEPNADIVLVHDAYGHPINSFASHYSISDREDTAIEKCWPKDELPQLLEAEGIFPRIVTYGWPASSWLDSDESPERAVDEFTTHLRKLRSNLQRPLIFIAHGLGGILTKHAISNLINFGLGDDDFQNPVKVCVFFGVPHKGLKPDNDFASILENIRGLSMADGPLSAPTPGLRRWNRPLNNISTEFLELQSRYGIDVLSFVEQERPEDGGQVIVPRYCGSFSHATQSFDIGTEHRALAKLPRGDGETEKVLKMISDGILQKLGKKPDAKSGAKLQNKENIYGRLREYDTVFLVDDSDSMEPLWKTTERVLAATASIAVSYDNNGVDVKFFNGHFDKRERTNLNTTEQVMRLFDKNTPPRGGTLTADVLDEVLNDYLHDYHRDRTIKGLNLIVLTDGEPDAGQDVEEVLRHYAKELKEAGAHRFKVGVQFVQIGGDEDARKFLEFLDDDLKAKHKLDRDVCDPSQSNCRFPYSLSFDLTQVMGQYSASDSFVHKTWLILTYL